jgi:hypothetical protein
VTTAAAITTGAATSATTGVACTAAREAGVEEVTSPRGVRGPRFAGRLGYGARAAARAEAARSARDSITSPL